jgi:hypothetical protein
MSWPKYESVFTLEEARRLAALTFRFHEKKFASPEKQLEAGEAHQPLVGKEYELLAALKAGEERYRRSERAIAILRDLRNSDREFPRQCARLALTLRSVRQDLSDLSEVMLGQLNSIATYQGSSGAEVHARIEALITLFQEGARIPTRYKRKKAGKKLGKSNVGVDRPPLEEFAKEIRRVLILPDVDVNFGFEVAIRIESKKRSRLLVSPAARLLHEAALLLDKKVDIPDIKVVMKKVQQRPNFREDNPFDDAIINALAS